MVINFRRPNFLQRLDLLTILLKQFRIDTENLVLLAKKTRGYTPADMKKIIKHALNRCLIFDKKLTANDLLRSLRYVTPTRSYDGGKELE
jgi:SpoVK/Ycf46/Vps4 family AAA+-type ATPase